jgi:hypothetical protein
MVRPKEFGQMLTEAVREIALRERKSVQIVQDELGYGLERESGGSAIEYWRKGHIPSRPGEAEQLARMVAARTKLPREWMERFARYGNVEHPGALCDALYPPKPAAPSVYARRAGPPEQAVLVDLAPFVVGPPITHCAQFFGREAELKRIFDGLSRLPLANFAVVGAQRSGKTSLLHYMRNITRAAPGQLRAGQRTDWLKRPDQYRWVFVDFQDIRMCRQESLLRYILTELGFPIPLPCTLMQFMDVMIDNLRQPTVVLFDEIEAALAAPELDMPFWWSLRSLGANQSSGLLSFIIASKETPDVQASSFGKPSPFFNIFQRMNLGPIAAAAANQLLDRTPRPFAAAERAWMIEQSGCYPVLLQILANALLEALESGDTNDWRGEGLRRIAPYRSLKG